MDSALLILEYLDLIFKKKKRAQVQRCTALIHVPHVATTILSGTSVSTMGGSGMAEKTKHAVHSEESFT